MKFGCKNEGMQYLNCPQKGKVAYAMRKKLADSYRDICLRKILLHNFMLLQ